MCCFTVSDEGQKRPEKISGCRGIYGPQKTTIMSHPHHNAFCRPWKGSGLKSSQSLSLSVSLNIHRLQGERRTPL